MSEDLPARPNRRSQLICLWCGPIGAALFGIGFWAMAGLVPPPAPSDSPAQVAELYRDNTDLMRGGLLVVCLGGGAMGGWMAAITVQLKRIEGESSPFAYTALGLGMLTLLVFVFPPMVMETALFRPERSPELLSLLHDLAWLPFIGIFSFPTVQCLAIAACVLANGDQRVLPRWFGYFNAWVGIGFAGPSLIYFFKTGPFAWNGFVAWWMPVAVFGAWMVVNTLVLRKAILSQPGTDPAPALA